MNPLFFLSRKESETKVANDRLLCYGLGLTGSIAVFFTTKIISRISGNKNLLVLSESIALVARIIAFYIGANDRFLNVGAIISVIAILSATQIFTNMKDIAHRALLSNSIDETELKNGKRTESIVFSMQNFVSKLISAVPKFIQGYVLKFLGFDPNVKHAEIRPLSTHRLLPAFLNTVGIYSFSILQSVQLFTF